MTARRPRRSPAASFEPKLAVRDDEESVLGPGGREGELGPEEDDDYAAPHFADEGETSAHDDEAGPSDAGGEGESVEVRDDAVAGGVELEAAEDADVGDLADDIVKLDATTRGERSPADERGNDEHGDDDPAHPQGWIDERGAHDPADEDEGAEGPEHEPLDGRFDALDRAGPSPTHDDADDAHAPLAPDNAFESGLGPPAFLLAEPSGTRAHTVAGPEVWCVAQSGALTWLAGDGLFALSAEQLEASTTATLRRVRSTGAPTGWVTSLAVLAPRVLLAAEVGGRVYCSEDGGQRWHPVGSLGDGDASEATVDLLAEPGGARVWARAHGGGLFRSEDGGRTWEGPLLDAPVRAFSMDPEHGTLWVGLGGARPALACVRDGARVEPVIPALASTPVAVTARGDVFAVALARGAGLVRAARDTGVTQWPLLRGASALAFVPTDDGAPLLLAAVHDEVSDRSTVLSAALANDGTARAAQRWVDAPRAAGREGSREATHGERDEDSAIHTLLPLDARGTRVLAITGTNALLLRPPQSQE